jgi:hypothetical protein
MKSPWLKVFLANTPPPVKKSEKVYAGVRGKII